MSTILFHNIVKAVLEERAESEPERFSYHEDVIEALKEPCLGINGILGEFESGSFSVQVNEENGDLDVHLILDEVVAREQMKEYFLAATDGASHLSFCNSGEDEVDITFTYEGALTVDE